MIDHSSCLRFLPLGLVANIYNTRRVIHQLIQKINNCTVQNLKQAEVVVYETREKYYLPDFVALEVINDGPLPTMCKIFDLNEIQMAVYLSHLL